MVKMSFFDGSLNKSELKQLIKETNKPILYTYGFRAYNPTTKDVPKSKVEALWIVDNHDLLDATEEKDCLILNTYSGSDML